jgi:aminobenzoyl-glutamate utilization protein B
MALTMAELYSDPSHLVHAKAEFDRRTAGHPYKALIGDQKPPLDYRK